MKDFKKEIANNEAAAAPVKYAVPTVTSSPTKATSKVCMESKSFQTFRSNMEWLDTHVQLVDASLIYAIKSMKKYPDKDQQLGIVLNSDESGKYPQLNHPVRQYSAIFKQSQNRLIEFSICQIYRNFIEYLHSIVSEMYHQSPLSVVESLCTGTTMRSLNYYEIINLSNYEMIQRKMVDDIFRGLERLKDTPELLKRILKCGNIDGKLAKNEIEKAMKYIDLRHLFIHHHGKFDELYIEKYKQEWTIQLMSGNKIPTSYQLHKETRQTIFDLCQKIDRALIKKGVIIHRT